MSTGTTTTTAVRLGATVLEVHPIAFGTWQLGGDWGAFDEETAIAAIRQRTTARHQLLRHRPGLRFRGVRADPRQGAARRARPAARVVITTKGGLRMTETASSATPARSSCAPASSRACAPRRRGVDLYQVHWPDPKTPSRRPRRRSKELVEQGKIKHVGVSNFNACHMAAFTQTLPVETLQPPYHLFRRTARPEILPYARNTTSACSSTGRSRTGC